MTTEQLTERIIEHGEEISALHEQVKTLFETTKQIKGIAESTNKIAVNVETLAQGLTNVDKRLEYIENDEKKKNFEVWKAVVCGAIGFAVAFILEFVMK